MKKFAVVLSGCGVYDGAEIQEAVLTLLAIDQAGAQYQCFAPNMLQHHVVDHVSGNEMPETRNVLVESARIARGNIQDLSEFQPSDFDGLIFPGGFGAAKNLCDWAFTGDRCQVHPEIEKAILSMHHEGKPIGAMCIAPVILARVFNGISLTTGADPASASFIEKMGNKAIPTNHGEVVSDQGHKIFTTPCYMLDASISQIAEGTTNLVGEMMLAMNNEPKK